MAQYEAAGLERLKAKVEQFPRGTVFVTAAIAPDDVDELAVEKKVRAIVEAAGMVLKREP